MLAGETAPTDSTSPGVVQEERAETVAGRETVQQTGGVGHVVVVQLTVNPATVSQEVLLSAEPGGLDETHPSRQFR